MNKPAKRLHLLPILSFFPLIIVLIFVSNNNIYLDQFFIAMVAIAYVAINIIYRSIHGTLNIAYIIEYSLIALIAYFVLTEYV